MPEALQGKPQDGKPLKSTQNQPAGGSETAVERAPKLLKSTLNLPQTTFPMKANLPDNEPKRLASWQQQHLYAQIRVARGGQRNISSTMGRLTPMEPSISATP